MEHYDDSPDEDAEIDPDAEDGAGTMGMFGNVKSLVYHNDDDEDPYITMKEEQDPENDEEREELQVLATDNMVLAGRVEDDVAHLEVYVYEDEADNLYVHHDVMLPAIPLCVEWLDSPVGKKNTSPEDRGNFVAVGTMDPDIELWDLDTVDCMYPNAILGQGAETNPTSSAPSAPSLGKKKKRKSKKAHDDYHVDAVLSLAANRQHRNLLASASADTTVKLWDLYTARCAKSYTYHTDKVCALAWHPQESTALLSGSYDRSVVAADMRAPDAGIRRWTVDVDVESLQWNPHDTNYFYVSTESGILHYFDARNTSAPVWRLQAHAGALSAFSANPIIPGFIATGSSDKTVKLWNVPAGASGDHAGATAAKEGPSMVISRDLGVGRVFSTTFAPDKEVGFRLAVAGSSGSLKVWDTSTNAAVRRAFAGRVAGRPEEEVSERLVGLELDDETSDSDEDEDEDGEDNGKAADEGSEDDDDV